MEWLWIYISASILVAFAAVVRSLFDRDGVHPVAHVVLFFVVALMWPVIVFGYLGLLLLAAYFEWENDRWVMRESKKLGLWK